MVFQEEIDYGLLVLTVFAAWILSAVVGVIFSMSILLLW